MTYGLGVTWGWLQRSNRLGSGFTDCGAQCQYCLFTCITSVLGPGLFYHGEHLAAGQLKIGLLLLGGGEGQDATKLCSLTCC